MTDKIRVICEGDLDCESELYMDKEEVAKNFKEGKSNLCEKCKPKYGHLSSRENMDLDFHDIGEDN